MKRAHHPSSFYHRSREHHVSSSLKPRTHAGFGQLPGGWSCGYSRADSSGATVKLSESWRQNARNPNFGSSVFSVVLSAHRWRCSTHSRVDDSKNSSELNFWIQVGIKLPYSDMVYFRKFGSELLAEKDPSKRQSVKDSEKHPSKRQMCSNSSRVPPKKNLLPFKLPVSSESLLEKYGATSKYDLSFQIEKGKRGRRKWVYFFSRRDRWLSRARKRQPYRSAEEEDQEATWWIRKREEEARRRRQLSRWPLKGKMCLKDTRSV